MKNFYFKHLNLLLLLFISGSIFSQTPIVNHPPNRSTAMNSSLGSDGKGIFASDSFYITGGDVALGELTVYGMDMFGDLEEAITGFNIYIFANDNEKPLGNPADPSEAIHILTDIPLSAVTWEMDEENFDITIQITEANNGEQVILEAGEYWLSAFPTVATPLLEGSYWYWNAGSGAPYEPVFIDPDNLAGGGFTEWTLISSILPRVTTLAWKLTNEDILETGSFLQESISLYPNPTSDMLHISIPSDIVVNKISVTDMLGRTINFDIQNSLNLSLLSTGMYMVTIETDLGIYQEKIVKQ